MLKKKITAVLIALLAGFFSLSAQEAPEKPDPVEVAEKEAERLESSLGLEDWQVFYVDSTLRHNYTEMIAELERLSRSRVENSDLYLGVQDKWMERTQNQYRKIFTEAQWAAYLKQGGARIIKEREKRLAKSQNQANKVEGKKK